jgi:hypothetical protein
LSGGLSSHAFALLVSGVITVKPGFKTLLGYHIIVVEAIEDIGQQFIGVLHFFHQVMESTQDLLFAFTFGVNIFLDQGTPLFKLGKGVAIKSTTHVFNWMREKDEDDVED